MSGNADWQDLIDRRFYEIPLHRRLGLVLVQQGEHSVVTMELNDELRAAAAGSVHGGVLATLADVTCAAALSDAFDPLVEMPVTTDMHVRYYRQPRSGPLRAEGRLVHRGRRICSAECAVADADERVLIRATATYMMVALDLASGS
jgi:uncharacterized protein (TIGR00369 family)